MALTYRTMLKNCYYLQNITKPVKWSVGKKYPVRILASGICYKSIYSHKPLIDTNEITLLSKHLRQCSTQNNCPKSKPPQDDDKVPGSKQGLIQKFKLMYRDYWYVLLPVHVATSIVWFGSFYYTVRRFVP